jgi:hypothetical protein
MSRFLIIALLLWGFVPAASGQTVTATTGAMNGSVSDSTGAVLPGVTVTLTSPAMMGTATTVTDEHGTYRFSALAPGEYSVKVELSGFRTVSRGEIRIGVGFTATVNSEMSPGEVSETVTVSGASPVVDISTTNVVTRFEADKLASLPGSRDYWSVVAQVPAVKMDRVDVGGNNALTQQAFTSYGLASSTGLNRNEVEGIRAGASNGTSADLYYTDYGSFAEIAVKAVGNTASMSAPGVLGQFVSKAGGNSYHGNFYADYQTEALQATNIDEEQIALGLQGAPGFDVYDLNRMEYFRDLNADLGGYVKKDALWWYGAYRYTQTSQRYPNLIDEAQKSWNPVYTTKWTYNVNQQQKLIAYYQYTNKRQPDYLFGSTTILKADALPDSYFPVRVVKGEYNLSLGDNVYLEVRAGAYISDFTTKSKSPEPRVQDSGANTAQGGVAGGKLTRSRPQANGSLSYFKSGWVGMHTFKVGGEIMKDNLTDPFPGYGHPSNSVSYLNNGVPTQVDLYLGTNVSKSGLWTYAGYIDDSWQPTRRVTLSLGLRLDYYVPLLPEQDGPTGTQHFDEVNPILTWSNWGPRAGVSIDVLGDAKMVLKASYGQFWFYPSVNFGNGVNPNPAGWYIRYPWADLNGNGYWDSGEEDRRTVLSRRGGSTSTRMDPDLENQYVRQATVYVEREIAAHFGVRTGFVWNGRRQTYGSVDSNRPLSAYDVPIEFRDPGPDGRLGTSDDGATYAGFNLSAAALAAGVVNLTRNLENNDSDYYTWEITANRRQVGRWSVLASFAHTWSRESALGAGTSYTPNVFINSNDGLNTFTNWQGKISGALELPRGFRVVPILRHQAGDAFGRTFQQRFNYGTVSIKAEPRDAQRGPNVTVFDVRTEKAFRFSRARLVGFFDVYNMANANAEQVLTTSSGASWLRPIAITPPRIARLGLRLDW